MMGVFVCGGHRELTSGKMGIVYFEYKDGEINEENKVLFSLSKQTRYPVGYLIEIKEEAGNFSGFTYASNSQPLQHPRVADYRMEHAHNIKLREMEATERKARSFKDTIEGRTIKELKEWANSRGKRRVLRYYMMEMLL